MVREFEILADVYGEPNKQGISKIIKKGLIIRRQFDMYDVVLSEYTNEKGNILKKYTLLIDNKNNQTYKVNAPYEKIKGLKLGLEVKGFIRY